MSKGTNKNVNPYTENILIVDDTPGNLRFLAEILTENGYIVRAAPNGTHALATIQKELPDLILLDIMMPGINGYELCEKLKAELGWRPIVNFESGLAQLVDHHNLD